MGLVQRGRERGISVNLNRPIKHNAIQAASSEPGHQRETTVLSHQFALAFGSGRCARPQESSARKTGRSFLPKGVSEYSTRTGIS